VDDEFALALEVGHTSALGEGDAHVGKEFIDVDHVAILAALATGAAAVIVIVAAAAVVVIVAAAAVVIIIAAATALAGTEVKLIGLLTGTFRVKDAGGDAESALILWMASPSVSTLRSRT
jgi:NADH dehydrogenase/NADH:ubiquinone oxidoreductase subunit G